MTASAGRQDRWLRRNGLITSGWRSDVIAVHGFKSLRIKTLKQKDGEEPRNAADGGGRGKRAVRSAGALFKVAPGPLFGAITFHLPLGREEVANPQLHSALLHCTALHCAALGSSSCSLLQLPDACPSGPLRQEDCIIPVCKTVFYGIVKIYYWSK